MRLVAEVNVTNGFSGHAFRVLQIEKYIDLEYQIMRETGVMYNCAHLSSARFKLETKTSAHDVLTWMYLFLAVPYFIGLKCCFGLYWALLDCTWLY